MSQAVESQSGSHPAAKGRRLQKSIALFAMGLMVQVAIIGLAMKGTAQYDKSADLQVVATQTSAGPGGFTQYYTATLMNAGPDSAEASSFLYPSGGFPDLAILSCDTNLGTAAVGITGTLACSADHGNVPPGFSVTLQAVYMALPGEYDWEFDVSSNMPDPNPDDNFVYDSSVVEPPLDIEIGPPDFGIGVLGRGGIFSATLGANVPTVITAATTFTTTTDLLVTLVSDPPGIFECFDFLPIGGGGVEQYVDDKETYIFWNTAELLPGAATALGGSCVISGTGKIFLDAELISSLPFTDTSPANNVAQADIAVVGLVGDSLFPAAVGTGSMFSATHSIRSVDINTISNLTVRSIMPPSTQFSATYQSITAETSDPESSVDCEIIAPTEWRCRAGLAPSGVISITTGVQPTAGTYVINNLTVDQNDAVLLRFNQAATVQVPVARLCDANGDGAVNLTDILIIVDLLPNQSANHCPVCDLDGDDIITVLDLRGCIREWDIPRSR